MSFSLRLYLRCDRDGAYEVHLDLDEARVWEQAQARGWIETPDHKHLCPKCGQIYRNMGGHISYPVKIDPV
jgi:hypothetical protein